MFQFVGLVTYFLTGTSILTVGVCGFTAIYNQQAIKEHVFDANTNHLTSQNPTIIPTSFQKTLKDTEDNQLKLSQAEEMLKLLGEQQLSISTITESLEQEINGIALENENWISLLKESAKQIVEITKHQNENAKKILLANNEYGGTKSRLSALTVELEEINKKIDGLQQELDVLENKKIGPEQEFIKHNLELHKVDVVKQQTNLLRAQLMSQKSENIKKIDEKDSQISDCAGSIQVAKDNITNEINTNKETLDREIKALDDEIKSLDNQVAGENRKIQNIQNQIKVLKGQGNEAKKQNLINNKNAAERVRDQYISSSNNKKNTKSTKNNEKTKLTNQLNHLDVYVDQNIIDATLKSKIVQATNEIERLKGEKNKFTVEKQSLNDEKTTIEKTLTAITEESVLDSQKQVLSDQTATITAAKTKSEKDYGDKKTELDSKQQSRKEKITEVANYTKNLNDKKIKLGELTRKGSEISELLKKESANYTNLESKSKKITETLDLQTKLLSDKNDELNNKIKEILVKTKEVEGLMS